MRRIAIAAIAIIAALISAPTTSARSTQPRHLTFEDRVRAQEAIERVYYSHQIGATRPFEEAFPREILEAKVRTYLKQSVALGNFWNTPITGQSLRAELERIAKNTRFPERLEEVYAALHRDPVLVLECFVRPTLASRLSRNFFAYDERIHGSAKAEAESLRQQLVRGEIDLAEERPERTVLDVALVQGTSTPEGLESRQMLPQAASDEPRVIDLNPEKYQRLRQLAPDQVGEAGDVIETHEEYVTRVLLSETTGRMRLASYTVPKTAWDAWWSQVHQNLDEHSVETLEFGAISLPGATSLVGGAAPVSQQCVPDDSWDNGTLDDMPDGRGAHTAVWTGSLMLVWGGNLAASDTGGRYDPLTDTWTLISTVNAPSRRLLHTAIWTGSLMVVWGGGDGMSAPVNTGGRYDPVTDRWTPTSILNAPSGRVEHGSVWTGNLMIVWGGLGTNTGGRYDPIADTWMPTSTLNAPSPRYYPQAVWTGDRMIVWGGRGGSIALSTGGRYDPVSDTWTPTSTSNAPSGRDLHTAAWTGTEMIVWGGRAGTAVNTGGRYNPLTDTWTATSTNGAPSARYFHTAIWTGNRMVVWGGTPNPSIGIKTGGRYDPATDTWTPTSTLNAPSARYLHTVVWTGEQIVVWGGVGGQSTLNTGGRYDPINDIWTPTTILSGPSAREMHSTVWTGSLMIVWGGFTDLAILTTGGRYDPLTDTWSPSSTVGTPAARLGHTAVWTGSLMIVWGGYSNRAYAKDGGRYDPVSDTWTPTSISNAPLGRYAHTAVWTGREMIVWGGDGSPLSDFPTSGGRYNPVTDMWSPTSTIDVPTGRWDHTAVWTGSQMIIYGGFNSDSFPLTGARYDPVADTWAPTSTLNAPQAVSFHSAVWTGDRMIVWGGYDSRTESYFDTGGQYDPISDAWTETSTLNAPTGRGDHTAVWTGSVMIVWGGYDWRTVSHFDTGGRYNPTNDTWIPTSTMGAPSGRFDHTAVWTGSQMIVWGGHGLVSNLGSGGRYYLGLSTDDDGDGTSECAGDCNDSNPAIHPGVSELCDGLDNDCDGATDEGLGPGSVGVTLDQATLWPPNHRMMDLRATVIIDGGCPAACPAPPDIVLASITSNEPDDATGIGDGQTINDIQGVSIGTADFDFSLRAERDGAGDGRLYQASYVVTDCFGETAVGYGGLFVPHDQAGETEPLLVDIVALPGGPAESYVLEWGSIAQATGYNVIRGRLSSIRAVGLFTVIDDAGCMARDLNTTALSGGLFEEDPEPGEGFFYLAEYVKGVPSGYGTESGSREMIIESGDSCH